MTKKTETDFVVRYTNKDIMDKLVSIEQKIEHSNSLSKKAMWAAGTALTIAITALLRLI